MSRRHRVSSSRSERKTVWESLDGMLTVNEVRGGRKTIMEKLSAAVRDMKPGDFVRNMWYQYKDRPGDSGVLGYLVAVSVRPWDRTKGSVMAVLRDATREELLTIEVMTG